MDTRLIQDIPFGDNLRAFRLRAGFSQEQAAAQLQLMGITMSREVISQMETGHHHVKTSVLEAMKIIYKVESYDEFFARRGGEL